MAVGSLVDPARLLAAPPTLALLIGPVVVATTGVAVALVRLGRIGARPLQLALGLGRVGESGYVRAGIRVAAGTLTEDQITAILGAIVVSTAGAAMAVRDAGKAPSMSVEDGAEA